MTAPGRIYLGLPAYNEEIALPRLLARVERFAASSQLPITVVVYNDGSTDTHARDRVGMARRGAGRVARRLRNKGLGAGLRALIEYAVKTGKPDDVLVVMDCDDTHDPAQIPDMLRAMAEGADVAIASRFATRRDGARRAGFAPAHRARRRHVIQDDTSGAPAFGITPAATAPTASGCCRTPTAALAAG